MANSKTKNSLSEWKSGSRGWRKGQRGMSSLAIAILLMPLLILAFGYGFDSLRLVYLRQALTQRLQMATQSAVNVNYVKEVATDLGPEYYVVLGTPDGPYDDNGQSSINRAYQVYEGNTLAWRANGKILTCDPPAQNVRPNDNTPCAGLATIVGSPLTNAQLCSRLGTSATYGVKYDANEEVSLTFLQILNIHKSVLHNLTSTSLVRAQNC